VTGYVAPTNATLVDREVAKTQNGRSIDFAIFNLKTFRVIKVTSL